MKIIQTVTYVHLAMITYKLRDNVLILLDEAVQN